MALNSWALSVSGTCTATATLLLGVAGDEEEFLSDWDDEGRGRGLEAVEGDAVVDVVHLKSKRRDWLVIAVEDALETVSMGDIFEQFARVATKVEGLERVAGREFGGRQRPAGIHTVLDGRLFDWGRIVG